MRLLIYILSIWFIISIGVIWHFMLRHTKLCDTYSSFFECVILKGIWILFYSSSSWKNKILKLLPNSVASKQFFLSRDMYFLIT